MPLALGDTKEKLKNAIIYFVTNDKNVGLTKLMKLLYYLDFRHYEETGHSVTGLIYRAWPYGPVPSVLYEELQGHDRGLGVKGVVKLFPTADGAINNIAITSSYKFSATPFTKREIRILENVSEIFKNVSAGTASEVSHELDKPWDITRGTKRDKAEIDYALALKDLDQDVIEEIKEAPGGIGSF